MRSTRCVGINTKSGASKQLQGGVLQLPFGIPSRNFIAAPLHLQKPGRGSGKLLETRSGSEVADFTFSLNPNLYEKSVAITVRAYRKNLRRLPEVSPWVHNCFGSLKNVTYPRQAPLVCFLDS